MIPSDTAKRICGTYIKDSTPPTDIRAYWQTQCRDGDLREAVNQFVYKIVEDVDANLVQVESTTADFVVCNIPCRLSDRESRSTFESSVRFKLNPVNGESFRLA